MGFSADTVPLGVAATVGFEGLLTYTDENGEFSTGSVGLPVYLADGSATGYDPGDITLTHPSSSGSLVQFVGYVVDFVAPNLVTVIFMQQPQSSTIAVDETNQTAQNVGPVTLFTPAQSGVWRLSFYEEINVAASPGTAAPFGFGFFGVGVYNGDDALQTRFLWTDDVGSRSFIPNSTPLDADATNFDQADINVRAVAGQPVQFQTQLAAQPGDGVHYSVFVRAEKL